MTNECLISIFWLGFLVVVFGGTLYLVDRCDQRQMESEDLHGWGRHNKEVEWKGGKRLYVKYSHYDGLWCIYNHDDPYRYIPLLGYTDEHNEGQRQAAQDKCDSFAMEVVR